MLENRQSNYDQVIENWRLKFLEMDQEELIRKFQLEADEEFLYIIYFSKRFRIDRKNGFITEDGKSPGFDTVMNIYNTFYYSAAHPVASGNLVAFRQVKRVYPFEAAYRRTIIFRLQELLLFHSLLELFHFEKPVRLLGELCFLREMWGMCFRYFLF